MTRRMLMLLSLSACGSEEETVVANGMKLAGKSTGNNAVDFDFTYPDTWTQIRNDGVIEIQYDCDQSAQYQRFATVTVLTFGLENSEMTAKEYWTDYEKQVEALYTDYKAPNEIIELNEKDKYIDDAPAIRAIYGGTLNGKSYTCDQVICCRYGKVYIITMVVPEEFYDSVRNIIDTVIEDFNFID